MLKTFLATSAIALTLGFSPVRILAESEPIHAETIAPSKLALIEELREVTNSDRNATQILDIMINQMKDQGEAMSQGIFGDNPDPATIEVFDETFNRILDRMYGLMLAEIDFETVQREIEIQLYDEYYSEAELTDLIAFYNTPTGQKTAEIYPQLSQRSMELFSDEVMPSMIKIQQQVLIEEFSAFDMFDEPVAEPEEAI